jgi:hypothetical protein
MADWLSRNEKRILYTLALVGWLVSAVMAARSGQPIPPPPVLVVEADPAPVPAPAAAPLVPPAAFGTGWVCDPDEVAAVSATLPVKVFSDTPAGAVRDIPKAVYGWQPYATLLARGPPVKNQGQVGSCVSFGTNTSVERTLASEIVRRKGTAGEWTRFVEEATYGGSRVEIGGGRINGDGSVGAWAAKWVVQYGMVPRKAYPGIDLTAYSEPLARQWGRSGVPAEFEAVAKAYPVKQFTQVKTWQEAKTAMAQDYFVAVCSNQGFTMQRDARGVCRPSGSWAHCMALDGYHTDADGKEYGHITNSWGDRAHTGPVGWGDPPVDGFWAESRVVESMLRQGDSWAFSGVTGFPARKPLNWLIRDDRLTDPLRHPFRPRDWRENLAAAAIIAW